MLVGQERLGCSLGALPFTGLPATRIAVSFHSSVLIGGHLPGGVFASLLAFIRRSLLVPVGT
jgi:hypothetical protein